MECDLPRIIPPGVVLFRYQIITHANGRCCLVGVIFFQLYNDATLLECCLICLLGAGIMIDFLLRVSCLQLPASYRLFFAATLTALLL